MLYSRGGADPPHFASGMVSQQQAVASCGVVTCRDLQPAGLSLLVHMPGEGRQHHHIIFLLGCDASGQHECSVNEAWGNTGRRVVWACRTR
jgi:hypothetical protein